MKGALAVLLALVLMTFPVFPASGEVADYAVRPVPVWEGDRQTGVMDLRFYADAPHVPYFGMKAYLAYLRGEELTVTAREGGVWEVAVPGGAAVRVNPAGGTMTAPDWAPFQNPLPPYTTMIGVKDSPCPWTCYTDLVFDDAPHGVIFDFAKYGISLHADSEDVYLPLALLSTMFTDLATNYVVYNGEKVFRPSLDMYAMDRLPAGYYESERMQALLNGEAKREEDEIRESYGELCFVLDYFFGHPGRGAWDESIRRIGLDETLKEKNEKLRDALLSDDMVDCLAAIQRLLSEGLNDGHTVFSGIRSLRGLNDRYPEVLARFREAVTGVPEPISYYQGELQEAIAMKRFELWGNENYREYGSTAIIRLDAFIPDPAGWEAFFAGTGPVPQDTLGIVLTGLRKASENPAVKNILLDLSANSGGSNDTLSAVLSLLTGDNRFRGRNVLTGQRQHAVVRVDRNLDGVMDEKDDEVSYDFRYAVLTSRMSFSCGNLFPFLMQENGAVLLGEPSGGGSCAVQFVTLSGGVVFSMSSYLWALEDAEGNSIESGCKTDLPIERIETEAASAPDPRLTIGDYTPFFDDAALDRLISDWFARPADVPAAWLRTPRTGCPRMA